MELYITAADRRRIVTRWLELSLLALHIWATMLILAVLAGRNSEIISTMFSTVTFGIGATLLILLLEKAADVILTRLAGNPLPAGNTTAKVEGKITLKGAAGENSKADLG